MSIATYDSENKSYYFECPHCNNPVQVFENEIACTIFRHAVYKNSWEQINPHTSKEICDKLFADNLIIGCGKPFKFFKGEPSHVEKCDYI